MSDGISDLDKNRVLAEWLEWQLRQVRSRIRELEVKEQQEERARQRARAEQSWKIQPQRGGMPAMLHRGGCGRDPGDRLHHRPRALILPRRRSAAGRPPESVSPQHDRRLSHW
ncbi:hypothetical protein OG413_43045 [Streptomyces sp. NBC_01433]|uniref:hypothetical protein n=1 Tax=Streptomyces sp. NBC_01433 TaxID=2903864 RepID=UPI00225540EC|nr:hypothetical protein [Streptomyces sp. NBC_01433]MCX4681972.1 hypothetical protein [Streptomyces sp. NBC_01433]